MEKENISKERKKYVLSQLTNQAFTFIVHVLACMRSLPGLFFLFLLFVVLLYSVRFL